MATEHKNPAREATDDEIPPGIRKLLPAISELMRAATRLMDCKGDYWLEKAKAVKAGRDV